MLFALIQTSCTKDEDYPVDPNGAITVVNVAGTSAEIDYTGDLDDDPDYKLAWGKRIKGEEKYDIDYNIAFNGGRIITGLDYSTTYEVAVFQPNGDTTPYNTVEFTTEAFEAIEFINVVATNHIFTSVGEEITFKITKGKNDLGITKLYLATYIPNNDDYSMKEFIELDVTKNGSIFSFTIPKEALPLNYSYTKNYELYYGTNTNRLNKVYSPLSNGRNFDPNFIVFNSKIALNKVLKQSSITSRKCNTKKAYYINFEGVLYDYTFLQENKPKKSIIIKNLDNNAELILSDDLADDCNRFYTSRLETYQGVVHNGLEASSLYVEFIKDESQGLVAGNYSIKANYALENGDYFETNTFEFEITE